MKRLSWKPGAAVAGIGLFALLTGILLQLTPRNLWRELFYQPLGLSAGWSLGRVVYWVGIALLAVGVIWTLIALVARRKPGKPAGTWVCAACGASNQAGSHFCGVCGKPAAAAGQGKTWRCSVCGGMNPAAATEILPSRLAGSKPGLHPSHRPNGQTRRNSRPRPQRRCSSRFPGRRGPPNLLPASRAAALPPREICKAWLTQAERRSTMVVVGWILTALGLLGSVGCLAVRNSEEFQLEHAFNGLAHAYGERMTSVDIINYATYGCVALLVLGIILLAVGYSRASRSRQQAAPGYGAYPPPMGYAPPAAGAAPVSSAAAGWRCSCGMENGADARFCAACGKPRPAAQPVEHCPACGAAAEEPGQAFCSHCGKPMAAPGKWDMPPVRPESPASSPEAPAQPDTPPAENAPPVFKSTFGKRSG